MKLKAKIIVALCLVVIIVATVLSIAFSSNNQSIEENINNSNIMNIGTTTNDISNKKYSLMLENDKLQFWMNKNTTEFKIVNKVNDSEWYSSNKGRADGSLEAAIIHLSYINSQGGIDDMDVMSNSVVDGKYSIQIENEKVTVHYSVGEFTEILLVPYALTEERFQAIKNSLSDEFQQMKLIDLYYLTDINIIEDDDLKKKRLEEYPMLSEQKLYIIRDSIKEDSLAKKDVAAIFADAGYSQRDYDYDSKFFKTSQNSKISPGFNIAVEYTLDGNKLNVKIPHDSIEMHSEYPMTSFTFAPYFGSPQIGDKGWFLLPDGSGSLMNFYNGKSNQIYRTNIYGQEKTLASREDINADIGASLPVFGIKNKDGGVLCEVTDGEAISQIAAYSGGGADVAYAHAIFNVRATHKTTTSTGKKETFVIVQKQRYTGDIALTYNFLNSKNPTLADMANVVRKNLFGDFDSNTLKNVPVMLEQIGLVTKQNQFLGVAYNQKVPLTEFKQSLQITNDFLENGVDNVSVLFSGWFGDGVEHAFLKNTVVASKNLGSNKELTNLMKQMKSRNVSLYLDADVQYTGKTTWFDGFNKIKDTVTMLDQSTGKSMEYDKASFVRDVNKFKYINNISAQLKSIDNFTASLQKYNVKNISLRKIGSELFADYGNVTVDRQEMANTISESLKALKNKGYNITTEGTNAYALPYLTNALNVPVSSSGFDMTNMSVPFLQMVISGKINYYAPALNLSGDVKTAMLKAVSAGAGFSCVLTAQNSDKLSGSNQNYLYSTNYDYWKNSLPSLIADYQKRLKSVSGRQIVDYKKITEGVYQTVYDNDISVIVNFNNEEFEFNNVKIKPKDFILKGVS